MSKPQKGDVKGFIKDLAKLSRKYNVVIGGCGCNGSPFARELGNIHNSVDCITWNPKKGEYTYDE